MMLIGEMVCLAPILQADANLIYNWHNTQEIMHLDGIYRPVNQTRFDEWFNSIGKDAGRVVFSIRRRSGLDFIGYIQVANINTINGTGEIGLMIGMPENRGHGFGSEALALLTDFCWRELNLQRLALQVIGPNTRAIKAYLRAGFELEGIARRAVFSNGRYVDSTLMAKLRPLVAPEVAPTVLPPLSPGPQPSDALGEEGAQGEGADRIGPLVPDQPGPDQPGASQPERG